MISVEDKLSRPSDDDVSGASSFREGDLLVADFRANQGQAAVLAFRAAAEADSLVKATRMAVRTHALIGVEQRERGEIARRQPISPLR